MKDIFIEIVLLEEKLMGKIVWVYSYIKRWKIVNVLTYLILNLKIYCSFLF
jgi:hypothetical protein